MRYLCYLSFFVCIIIGCSSGETKQPRINTTVSEFKMSDKMDEDEFWKIIDYSNDAAAGEMEKQVSIIVEKLSKYDTTKIVGFETILSKKIIEANNYKILAANKIIDGSVTDDGFLYFRFWLISLGKKAFEQTLKNPDSLAKFTDKEVVPDDEILMNASTKAYQIRTGKTKEDDNFPRDVVYNKGINYESDGPKLTGKNWTENELPKLYPILWNKFN